MNESLLFKRHLEIFVFTLSPQKTHCKCKLNALWYTVIKTHTALSLCQNNMDNDANHSSQKIKIKEKEKHALLPELTRSSNHDEVVTYLALTPVTLYFHGLMRSPHLGGERKTKVMLRTQWRFSKFSSSSLSDFVLWFGWGDLPGKTEELSKCFLGASTRFPC